MKKILCSLLAISIFLTMAACSSNGKNADTNSIEQSETTNPEEESQVIEQTKENLFELGEKQTKDIIEVLKTHNLQTQNNGDVITKEFWVTSPSIKMWDGIRGYELGSNNDVIIIKEGDLENNYRINYLSGVKGDDEVCMYFYSIKIIFPSERIFKIDEYPLFKNLVTAHFGEGYDFVSFEIWVQTHLENVNKDRYQSTSRKSNSSYNENLRDGYDSEGQRELTYTITLQK